MTSLYDLPHQVIDIIVDMLCQTDIYRDKYDIAKDALSLFCTRDKSLVAMSKQIFCSIIRESKLNFAAFDDKLPDICSNMSIKSIKDVCKKYSLPVSGTKSTLLGRIHFRFSNHKKIILDCAELVELESLRYKEVSIHAAMHVYGLTTSDLNALTPSSKGYVLRHVRDISINKYGDAIRLQQHKYNKNIIRKLRHDAKTERVQKRLNELQEIFENLLIDKSLLGTVSECELYLRTGNGSLTNIKNNLEELVFLKNETPYDLWIEYLGKVNSNTFNFDKSKYPSDLHLYCRRMALKHWILSSGLNKMSALESNILPGCLQSVVRQMTF